MSGESDNEREEETPLGKGVGLIRVKELQRDNFLNRISEDAKKTSDLSALSLHQLEVKLSLLERLLESFEKVQNQLESLDESQFNQDHRVSFEESYFNIKSQILERMALLRLNVTDPMMSSTRLITSPVQQPLRTHLPKLQLTTFSGKYKEWTEFYNVFSVSVHDNVELSSISKFQYLRLCLTEKAATLIQSMEITPENYIKAIDLLKSRYDNKRAIFQAHIAEICAVKDFTKPNVSMVRDFIDSVNANLRSLETIASKEQISDGILLYMMTSKLDSETQAKWEEELFANWDKGTTSSTLSLPKWNDLSLFLERRCKTLDIIAKTEAPKQSAVPHGRSVSHNQSVLSKKRQVSSFVASNQTTMCIFCNTSPSHNVFQCTKFIAMNNFERFRTVKRLKLCLNCLGSNHIATSCPSTNKCQHCNSMHHTLLHKGKTSPPPSSPAQYPPLSTVESENQSSTSAHIATQSPITLQVSRKLSQVILGTARVMLQAPNGRSRIIRALLDSASQLHFVTESVAQHLRVFREKINMEVSGIGLSSTNAYNMCSLVVKSSTTSFSSPITAVVIPSITSYQPQTSISINNWTVPGNIKLADSSFNLPGPIDLLIGADLFYELLLVGQIKKENSPTLQKTKLGWIVVGSVIKNKPEQESNTTTSQSALCTTSSSLTSPRSSNAKTTTHHKLTSYIQSKPSAVSFSFKCLHLSLTPSYKSLLVTTEPLLENILERFWKIEECPSDAKNKLTAEEYECERFFEKTTTRCPITNKFIVRLPFKSNPKELGPSFEIAARRFYLLEKKLGRDEKMRREYYDFIREYCDLKHMVKAGPNNSSFNYIPHHGVVKPDSSTTKLRVVFDASCRTVSGVSLNNILRVGPTLQEDIFSILTRFRFHKFVLVADIAKMYRQVLVDDRDTQWQCILWRATPSDPLSTYMLKTVTYGTSSAPYLAVKCLQVLAKEEANNFPVGSAVTCRDFYVDNLMTGGNSIEEVEEIKRQVTELLKRGGFPLRKFAANCESVIADVPSSEREEIVKVDDSEYIKTLGLKWSPKEDTFSYSYNNGEKSTSKITKRTILSHTAKLFDPLGLVNPIVVRCKILLQGIWSLKLHWDESVPQDVMVQWEEIRTQLMMVPQIKLPRFVNFNVFTNVHAFADASTKAYGACVYAVTNCSGTIGSSLLCSKSRVAPLKTTTLPRLELCAAVLLSDLINVVLKLIPLSPQSIICWSDSTITLCWIAGESTRWKPFVKHRVEKIKQNLPSAIWRHVPSELNPADILSRGTTVSKLINDEMWFHGPRFLLEDESLWPRFTFPYPEEAESEMRNSNAALISAITKYISLLHNHKFINCYEKLLRIFAYVRRYALSIIHKENPKTGPINAEEINHSLEFVCRIIQNQAFSKELKNLKSNLQIERQSKLSKLSPFLHDGLIRVGGRLTNSSLPFSVKHPIVLPSSHDFVHTIIRYKHRQHLHAGAQTLHNILRENLWIINPKQTIRRVIHNCILCYRYRPVTENQVMGSLPTDRVNQSYPFAVTGVDYCGPFYITQQIRGRSPIKVYIAVFICFSVKAVHLELVPDLTTNAFIAALKRFISRRGRCSTIYSDNATNFIGANRELKDLLQSFLSEQHNKVVQEVCRKEGIEWRFIPPRSPHFGGLWESAVKQAKHYLRRAIGSHILTFDELHTVSCQAEAIINSRPLTPISSDPNDLRPLTPAHFLVNRPLTTFPEPSTVNINPATLKRYHVLKWIQQQFWDRWRNEYLKTLQQRTKWTTVQQNLKIDDLVLIKEDSTPPIKWPLGRVIDTNPGTDGQVRVVTIKTAEGVLKRAVTKLCKLPIESATSSQVESCASKGGEC